MYTLVREVDDGLKAENTSCSCQELAGQDLDNDQKKENQVNVQKSLIFTSEKPAETFRQNKEKQVLFRYRELSSYELRFTSNCSS